MKSLKRFGFAVTMMAMLIMAAGCNNEVEPPHEHSWDDGTITTAATCTKAGVKTFACSGCKETKTEEIPATGHTWDDGKIADCTSGEKIFTCSVCSETKTEEIPATEHTWDDGTITTAATCATAGVKTFTCSGCEKTKTEEISATGHTWGDGSVTTAATCTKAGVKTFTCSVCSETKTEEIPAAGHTWDDGKVADCTSGEKTLTCSVCSETKTEQLPVPEHTFGEWGKPGSDKKKTRICSVCSAEESAFFYSASDINSIGSLTESAIVKIEGVISDTDISNIKTQLDNLASSIKIDLDLFGTTGLNSIGTWAFSDCSTLASITIPSGVTSIQDSAFSGCSSLTSVTITESVTSIQVDAFSGCSSLTSVIIPESVTSIGAAFSGCSSLKFTVSDENKNYKASDNGVILLSKDGKTLVAFPSASGTFAIQNGITSIQAAAFGYCSSLTSVTIPAGVTYIQGSAFIGCSSLKFTVNDKNKNYKASDDGVILLSKDGKTLVAAPSASGTFAIPTGITSIGDYAFSSCSSLTSVTIPSSVTSIGEGAFYFCNSLTSVTIPASVTYIGKYAFTPCFSLTSIEFSDKENWYSYMNEECTEGETAFDVTNATTNAENLKSWFAHWYKKKITTTP